MWRRPDHGPGPAGHHHQAEVTALPTLLRDAKLETIHVQAGTLAAGKMISELKLRTVTGASVVGIDRGGKSIVNPDPHEELTSGDQVLLIGRTEQLKAAKILLSTPQPAQS